VTVNPKEFNANQFIGKTARTPRPSPEAHKGTHEMLVRDQQRWDQAKAWDADNQQRRADHIAEVDAKREQRRQADQERRIADQLAPAKAAFLVNGGTLEEWERRKDAVTADIAHRAAVAAATESDPELVRMRRSGAYTL